MAQTALTLAALVKLPGCPQNRVPARTALSQ